MIKRKTYRHALAAKGVLTMGRLMNPTSLLGALLVCGAAVWGP